MKKIIEIFIVFNMLIMSFFSNLSSVFAHNNTTFYAYSNDIYEFDSLDELRQFDQTYIENTRSKILCELALKLGCVESAIVDINVVKNSNGEAIGFSFMIDKKKYRYLYDKKEEKEIR